MSLDPRNAVNLAEIQKIYNEIHQLRNQQFLITLAAITFFGVVAAWLFNMPIVAPTDPKTIVPIGSFRFGLVIGLLFVLGILFVWLGTLSKMIARLSTYLEKRQLSTWEVHHSLFDSIHPRPVSQRHIMAYVFLTLGTLGVLIPLSVSIDGRYALEPGTWFIAMLFVALIYLAIVYLLGFQSARHNRDEAMARWNQVLGHTAPNDSLNSDAPDRGAS